MSPELSFEHCYILLELLIGTILHNPWGHIFRMLDSFQICQGTIRIKIY